MNTFERLIFLLNWDAVIFKEYSVEQITLDKNCKRSYIHKLLTNVYFKNKV